MQSLQSQSQLCTRTQWIMGGVLVLGIGLAYGLWCRPENNRLSSLHEDIHLRQRQLQANQTQASLLPQVQVQVEQLRKKLADFGKAMPKQPDLGQFIREVTQLSQRAALRKVSVQPGVPRRCELFCELPITLQFEGEFMSVFAFLQQAEDMQRLTRIHGLSIKSKDLTHGQVEVQLSMNIYFAEGG